MVVNKIKNDQQTKDYSNYVAVNFVTMWELMKNPFLAMERDNGTYFSKNDLRRFFEQYCKSLKLKNR